MQNLLMRSVALFLICTHLTLTAYSQMGMDDCSMHMDDMAMHMEHCAVFALVAPEDATVISIASGNWFNGSTWNTGTVPSSDDRVLIDSGHTIIYNGSSEEAIFTIRVDGQFDFATDINTKLIVNTLVVDPEGYMSIGTIANPIPSNITAEIIFPDQGPIDTEWDPFVFSKGLISHGHTEIHGSQKLTFTGLKGASSEGTSLLKLAANPTGWEVGDILLVAGTETKNNGSNEDNTKFQDELLEITSIEGKNVQFTNLANGSDTLIYNHQPPGGFGLRSYVGNMSRNITIRTENYETLPIQQRGHVMLMHLPYPKIQYASFIGLGRSDKLLLVDDPVVEDGVLVSGGTNPRGRYALHLHRAGRNDYMGEPVLLKGNVVMNTPGWGIVNHSSHADIIDNIVFEFVGSGFVTELGDELGTFVNNFAVKGTGAKDGPYVDPFERLYAFDLGHEGNGFWMKGQNVELINNVAASCDGSGFNQFSDDDQFTDADRPKVPKGAIKQPSLAGAEDSIYSVLIPIRKNKGSVAYNVRNGIFFWTHMYNDDNVGDFTRNQFKPNTHDAFSVIDNFKIWNISQVGISLGYTSQVHLKRGLLLGDIDQLFILEGDSVPYSESAGYGIFVNGVTGRIIMENIEFNGWVYAAPMMRTDNIVSGDEEEFSLRTSVLKKCSFENNLSNLYPQTGQDMFLEPGYNAFPAYMEVTEDNTFASDYYSYAPVASFTTAQTEGTVVTLDASASHDDDPYLANAGNGIAAYQWNMGDGTKRYGRDIKHRYNSPGVYIVQLNVLDDQGNAASQEQTIAVDLLPTGNRIENYTFAEDDINISLILTSQAFIYKEQWLMESNWVIADGKAMTDNSFSYKRPLTQVIYDQRTLRGTVPFSIQAKNVGESANENSLFVEVIGINGEFMDADITQSAGIKAINNADPNYNKSVLLSDNLSNGAFNWQTFKYDLNFGEGFDFIVVKIYSEGAKPAKNDIQGLDNICLPCSCSGITEVGVDEIFANTAYLYWDNVASNNYEVRIRPVGGSWTTFSTNNTYWEASDLSPLTNYEYEARSMCDGSWTSWVGGSFTTLDSTFACNSPENYNSGAITPSSATISWESVPDALQYRVSYEVTGTDSWFNFKTPDTLAEITGLLPGTNYSWKVIAECPYGWTEFLSTQYFNTSPLRTGEVETEALLEIVPNPASEIVQIRWSENNSGILQLIDQTGRIIHEEQLSENQQQTAIDVSSMSPGLYFIRISGGNSFANTSLIIE